MMQHTMTDNGNHYLSIILALLIFLILTPSCTPRSERSLLDQGGTIVLTSRDHTMKATKTASIDGTYILFHADAVHDTEALSYLDGSIKAILKEDADKLKKTGNVLNAESVAPEKNLVYLNILAANQPVQKQIKALIELTSNKAHPLIEVSMTEIQVTDLSYRKSKVFLSGDAQRQYLVEKIRILDENCRL